jgi:hypothetical protein
MEASGHTPSEVMNMEKPEELDGKKLPLDYWMPTISDVVSSTECTGLMYRPPQDEEELESYQELSSMEIPKRRPHKKPET